MSATAGSGGKVTSITVDRRDLQLVLRELHGRRAGASISLSTRMARSFLRLASKAWASADEDEASSPLVGGS
jgi:hypothetical protein